MSTVRMDVINTLVHENRAFAEELEEQIIRGQLVEKMLVNAQKVMTENTHEIQDLKQQLSLKDDILRQTEMEISVMRRTYDGSTLDDISSIALGSHLGADEPKSPMSVPGSVGEKDKDRERDAQLDSLKEEIKVLRMESQTLQALFINTENGDKLVKKSSSQSAIIKLQGELQDLQRLQLKDGVPESLHSGLKSPDESQAGPEDSLLWAQPEEWQGSVSSRCSTAGAQGRPEKQPLSGTTTPEDCLSIRSLASRLSGCHPADQQASAQASAPARGHSALQRHLSEAQVLITEMDTCIQDSFQTRLQEDSLTRAVIDSLVQQNQAIAQELELQMARVHEMEALLAEAYEQKAVVVSESQTAIEELQDFIHGRDKLLRELSEDYSLLKEEKSRLQSFFCDDGHRNVVLKKPFHQSQPQMNKVQGELLDLQRQQCTSSQSKLHLGFKADEERALGPGDSASVTQELNEFCPFLGGKLDEQHQTSVMQTGPAAAERATHRRKEYNTNTFKV